MRKSLIELILEQNQGEKAEELELFYRMAGQEPPWQVLERKLEKYRGQVENLMCGLKKEWI